MMVIGLTGGIGAGKSVVASVWADLGATVLTADAYGHKVLAGNKHVRRELTKAFGPGLFDKRGVAIRGEIGRRAFVSENSTRKLNRIVGKPLVEMLYADVARLTHRRKGVLVIDAALLCEWRSKIPFDLRVLVTAPRASRLKWLSRRGISYRQAATRMRMQWSDFRKRRWADLEIRNDGTEKQLRHRALHVWRQEIESL